MSIRKRKPVTQASDQGPEAESVAKQSPPAQRTATDAMLDSMRMTSVKKAAEVLNVSVTTVWNWLKSGELKSVKVGGSRRIMLAEVRRVQEGRK
jgi:excisionase family DNA binding protein